MANAKLSDRRVSHAQTTWAAADIFQVTTAGNASKVMTLDDLFTEIAVQPVIKHASGLLVDPAGVDANMDLLTVGVAGIYGSVGNNPLLEWDTQWADNESLTKTGSGGGNLATGVYTPTVSLNWTINELVGWKMTIGGSLHSIVSNTANTVTVTNYAGVSDGAQNYSNINKRSISSRLGGYQFLPGHWSLSHPLYIKDYLWFDTAYQSMYIGCEAFNPANPCRAEGNTVLGDGAFTNATSLTGGDNTAIGGNVLRGITTGRKNTIVGADAGINITTGQDNTAVGKVALYSSTTANCNTAVGSYALYFATGSNNTAVGQNAGHAVTIGTNNVFVGYTAGMGVTEGENSVFLGSSSGYAVTTGSRNVAIGNSALAAVTTGSDNVAVGNGAGYRFGAAVRRNVAIGSDATPNQTAGDYVVAIGYQAGYNITSGAQNTIVGAAAGVTILTGTNNCMIGTSADVTSGGGAFTDCVAIGANAVCVATRTTQIGYENSAGQTYCQIAGNLQLTNTMAMVAAASGKSQLYCVGATTTAHLEAQCADGTIIKLIRGAVVAAATGGGTVDAECRTATNLLITRLIANGLLASS